MTASHSASLMLVSMRSRRMPALLIEDVEAAEGVDRGLDEPLGAVPVADVVGVGDGLAAHGLDLVDDLLGRAGVVALAVHRAAEVVDHDLGAVVGQEQRVLAADAPAGARDDRDATLAQLRHADCSPFGRLMPRRPLRLVVGRGRDQTGPTVGGEFRVPRVHVGGLEPPWKMSTRRRPRKRLWSWSPSRRRRRGPRTSACPASRAGQGARGGGDGCCPVLLVPVVLVLLLVIAWAVDSSSGDVARNVRAGRRRHRRAERGRAHRTGRARPPPSSPAPRRAGRGRRRVRDHRRRPRPHGRRGRAPPRARSRWATARFVPARPFAWARRSSPTRQAPVLFQVNAEQVAAAVVALEGDARTPPTEPTVELVDGAFEVVPGVDGAGSRHRRHRAAAARASPKRPWPRTVDVVRLELEVGPDPAARHARRRPQAAADAAEELVSEPVEIRTSGGNRTITVGPAPLVGAAAAATPTAPWSSPSTRPRPPPPSGGRSPTSRAIP